LNGEVVVRAHSIITTTDHNPLSSKTSPLVLPPLTFSLMTPGTLLPLNRAAAVKGSWGDWGRKSNKRVVVAVVVVVVEEGGKSTTAE